MNEKVKTDNIVSKTLINSTTMSGKQGILFSFIFLGIGGYILGVSLQVLPFSGRINAPLEIVFLCGAIFFMGGVSIFIQSLKRVLFSLKIEKFKVRSDLYRWKWDYKWNTKGIRSRSSNSSFGHIMGVLILGSFLYITYWIGFVSKDGFKVPFYILSVFSIYIVFWFYSMLSNRVKYGKPFLRFLSFPFFTGEELNIIFEKLPPRDRVKEVIISLRYYEEFVTKNSKNQKSINLSEVYIESLSFPGSKISMNRDLVIKLPIPLNKKNTTKLSENPASFWEVQITCDIEGWDFRECFLLPVYNKN